MKNSGTIGVNRQNERVAEVPRSQMSVEDGSRNDVSKFLARQVLGMDLLQFCGDLTTYMRGSYSRTMLKKRYQC
jgi:hypothetical protein